MYISRGDTWQFGPGWLNKDIYGEGGFFFQFGFTYVNFWKRIE